MECFPVRYDSRVVIYDHRALIRLATEVVRTAISCRQPKRDLRLVTFRGRSTDVSGQESRLPRCEKYPISTGMEPFSRRRRTTVWAP